MYTSLTTSSFHDDKGEVGWGVGGVWIPPKSDDVIYEQPQPTF